MQDEWRQSPAKPFGEDGWLRTVKSCGPDASMLASSLAEARSAQPGRTKPLIREATVAKQPIAGEITK
jgi:hypothetical protein